MIVIAVSQHLSGGINVLTVDNAFIIHKEPMFT
jgi:hypothetical protein